MAKKREKKSAAKIKPSVKKKSISASKNQIEVKKEKPCTKVKIELI